MKSVVIVLVTCVLVVWIGCILYLSMTMNFPGSWTHNYIWLVRAGALLNILGICVVYAIFMDKITKSGG
jgi:hypothetical protein